MPTYEITSPEGQKYKITAPEGATNDEVMEYAQRSFKMAKAPEPEKSLFGKAKELAGDYLQGQANLLAGGIRGAGSIGATLPPVLAYDMAKDALAGKGLSLESNRQRRADMDAALASLGAETDSFGYGAGKLVGEVAGTAGLGGLIAKPVSMVAPRLAQAISTGGFSTGAPAAATKLGRAADMGIRVAGGGISGAASAGAVGDNVGMGAAIGGALPPVATAAGMVGRSVGSGVMSMLTPAQRNMAVKIAETTGQKIEDVIAALDQPKPTILGIKPTVPQVLQDNAMSQLQRTAINAGDTSLMAREAEQNLQRLEGLNRIAPVMGTVNEAADSAGNLISRFGKDARSAETRRVTGMFEGVDPFGDTAIELPIDAMQAAKNRFLGAGTFGKGNEAQTALNVAREVGTQSLDAINPITQKAAKSQSLEQAVRAMGGIRGTSGELRDLALRESGTTGLVNNKSGQSLDILAEEMHRRGFIPNADPDTLINAIRNKGGRETFATDVVDDLGMQRQFEQAMGDAPGADVMAKPVSFQTVQNLRGSMNEAWKDASMAGRNQEAAALKSMISEIDNKIAQVSEGGGNLNEAFPADVANAYREALAAHAAKKTRFDTGPQARMFRQGGDGQAAIQGAEIPREFFNPRSSQVEDAQAFQRLAQGNPELAQALKSYAVTDAAQQTTKDGALSYNKFSKWLNSRSGAIKETMTPQDQALLKEILQGVKASDFAATSGMAKGSNTAQNLEAARQLIGNGMFDSKIVDVLANKLPLGGFGLDALRKSTTAGKANMLGGLLSDPDILNAELRKALARQNMMKSLLIDPRLSAEAYRAAPLLAGD